MSLESLVDFSGLGQVLKRFSDSLGANELRIVAAEERAVAAEAQAEERNSVLVGLDARFAEWCVSQERAACARDAEVDAQLQREVGRVALLAEAFGRDKGVRRLEFCVSQIRQNFARKAWRRWAAVVREGAVRETMRRGIERVFAAAGVRELVGGWSRWRWSVREIRAACATRKAAAKLADALAGKRLMRRGLRRWKETALMAALQEAEGGAPLEDSALSRVAKVCKVAQSASARFRNEALECVGRGEFAAALRAQAQGYVAQTRVLAANAELARHHDKQDARAELAALSQRVSEEVSEELSAALSRAVAGATVAATQGCDEAERRYQETLHSHVCALRGEWARDSEQRRIERAQAETAHCEQALAQQQQLAKELAQRTESQLEEHRCFEQRAQAEQQRDLAANARRDAAVLQLGERTSRAQQVMEELEQHVAQCGTFLQDQLSQERARQKETAASAQQEAAAAALAEADAREVAGREFEERLSARCDEQQRLTTHLALLVGEGPGGPPKRPEARQLCASVFCAYEALAFEKRRCVTLPYALACKAACVARALADYAASAANMEELERLAQGEMPGEAFDGAGEAVPSGPDEIAARRVELVQQFLTELAECCVKQRPSAGALRLEARKSLLKRFKDTVDAALSLFDQIISDAPTLFGRSKACVACDRPLATRRRARPAFRDATRDDDANATKRFLAAASAPERPRALPALFCVLGQEEYSEKNSNTCS